MMLRAYFGSVLIWMIIIYCMAFICKDAIQKNGWLDANSSEKKNWLKNLFILAAIPIIRLLVTSCMLYMTFTTKEEYEKGHKKDE